MRMNVNLKTLSLGLLAAGMLAGGMTLSVHAADTTATSSSESHQDSADAQDAAPLADAEGGFIVEQEELQTLASDVMGMEVHDRSDDDATSIGTVSDLIINDDDQLVGIVVGVGGFLGIGQKDVGMPWSRVQQIDVDEGVIDVEVSKEELEDAPAFRTIDDQEKEAEQEQREAELDAAGATLGETPSPDAEE